MSLGRLFMAIFLTFTLIANLVFVHALIASTALLSFLFMSAKMTVGVPVVLGMLKLAARVGSRVGCNEPRI